MDSSYNNLGGFGSGSAMPLAQTPVSTPVSSGTGDIVLTPEKKSHKKGIIISSIIAVLIVGGVLMTVFLNFGGGASNNSKKSFNRYANYLLFGEDSDADLNTEREEETEDYIINRLVAEEDSEGDENEVLANTFFSKATQLWDNFYKSLSDEELSRFDGLLDTYIESFEFTKIFMTNSALDGEIFASKYATMDKDSLDKWIRSHFADFLNSSYKEIQRYGENSIRYYDLYAEYLDRVKSIGCLNDDGEFISPCEGLNEISLSDEIEDIGDQMWDYQNEALSATVDDCWEIERILDNKDNSIQETNDEVEDEE